MRGCTACGYRCSAGRATQNQEATMAAHGRLTCRSLDAFLASARACASVTWDACGRDAKEPHRRAGVRGCAQADGERPAEGRWQHWCTCSGSGQRPISILNSRVGVVGTIQRILCSAEGSPSAQPTHPQARNLLGHPPKLVRVAQCSAVLRQAGIGARQADEGAGQRRGWPNGMAAAAH